MSAVSLTAGYIPLVDAAPLVVAKELGFAEEEGIQLDLRQAPSWSTLRDMLAFGQIEAAHMLAPVPVASALGLLKGLPALNALSVMSLNGAVIGTSNAMAARLLQAGYDFDFGDAAAAAVAVAGLPGPLRIGVPFVLSMHRELVSLWLTSAGLQEDLDFQVHAVPPQLMAQAIHQQEIDLFCVGEPWGSVVVENGDGALLLPSSAIWTGAPEKVLAVRSDWCAENAEASLRLLRAVWRAGAWLARPEKLTMVSEILASEKYLGLTPELIDPALSGRFRIDAQRNERRDPHFLCFHDNGASFPWRSQAAWIGARLAVRYGLDLAQAQQQAQQAYRSDLYRAALAQLGADLPLASLKLEGAQPAAVEVPAIGGSMILGTNRFFDGRIYDPTE